MCVKLHAKESQLTKGAMRAHLDGECFGRTPTEQILVFTSEGKGRMEAKGVPVTALCIPRSLRSRPFRLTKGARLVMGRTMLGSDGW